MALFQARTDLVSSAMPGFGQVVAIIIAAMPAIYLGRIAVAGLAPVSPAVAAGLSGRPPWTGGGAAGRAGGPFTPAIPGLPTDGPADPPPPPAVGVRPAA